MPSAPVVSVRVPCIDGLLIVTVTPGMIAPLASVILPLMAPVVVLTVWPSAAATDPKTRTRTNTGTWQCSRLMRLLRDRNTQRPRDLTPSVDLCDIRTDTTQDSEATQSLFARSGGLRLGQVRVLGCRGDPRQRGWITLVVESMATWSTSWVDPSAHRIRTLPADVAPPRPMVTGNSDCDKYPRAGMIARRTKSFPT